MFESTCSKRNEIFHFLLFVWMKTFQKKWSLLLFEKMWKYKIILYCHQAKITFYSWKKGAVVVIIVW